MFKASSLRYRYTQLYVLFILGLFIYVMARSIGPGITNFQDNFYKKDFRNRAANLLRMKLGTGFSPWFYWEKMGGCTTRVMANLVIFSNTRKMENEGAEPFLN